MAMFESHMLTNANNVTINNSSLNIGTSAKQSAYKKLSKAAAHSALHDAPARTDETRCHKNTRVKVIDSLERWAQGIFEPEASLFWLYGGAGAGKSAIMQTLAERCVAQKLALGSFFFSRSDSTRNNAAVLIPTLAYQVAQLFPDALQVLHPIVNRDTLIFKKSLQVQLMDLLVRPLQHLVQLGTISDAPKSARVLLIDGLDECENPDHQREIILAVATVCHQYHIPVKFLIASRPELPISTSFRSYTKANCPLGSISLSEDPSAQTDIQRFIEDQFMEICLHHPFNQFIPSGWPYVDDINALVQKSSSHFIYASTAIKYISSAKEDPVRSLQVILGLEVSRTGSPFAELDALYHHIFQSAGHRDKVLQILAHCVFSTMGTLVPIICIMHEYSLSDFHIFVADMTPLITISLAKKTFSDELPIHEVKLLHASLGDFLCDPSRSGSLHLDEHLYLASKLQRCVQLLELYSQNWSTEPNWPPDRFGGRNFQALYSEIHKTIRLSGSLDVVQAVLSRTSLHCLQSCKQLLSSKESGFNPYSGCVEEILVAICQSQTSTAISKRYMEEFLDIVESALKSGGTPLGPIILPLLFLGYPAPDLESRFFHNFIGTPSGKLLGMQFIPSNGDKNLLERVVKCITNSDPSIRHRRAYLSPGPLAAAIEAILDHCASFADNFRPAKSCPLCTVPDMHASFLGAALIWLLPTAGFSEKIQLFSQNEGPHLCEFGPCSKLKKHLDEYNVRFWNEGLNWDKNASHSGFLPFDSERPRAGSAPRMRAQDRESELRTPSIRVADPSGNHNSLLEGNTGTRKGNPGMQENLQPAANTGPLGSASDYGIGPSRSGGSLAASPHGARRALGSKLDKPRSVSCGPERDVEGLSPRPTRAFGDAGVLDIERNRNSPASKSSDGGGSTGWRMSTQRGHSGIEARPLPIAGHTTRHGASRYNMEPGPCSSQVGHSEAGAVIGASSPRMGSRPFPRSGSGKAAYGQNHQETSDRTTSTAPTGVPGSFGYITHERERELEEMRALREQHAIEMKALRSQLEDAQRTVNNLREENGQLREENGQLREGNGQLREENGQIREENGQLREENGRLRDGLDSVIDFMRGIESLRQPRAKHEMEKLRLLDPHT